MSTTRKGAATPIQGMHRLWKLYNLLCEVEELPNENLLGFTSKNDNFNMRAWILDKEGINRTNDGKAIKCKTAACIGGWATQVIPELGLIDGELVNTKTDRNNERAFADAFGLSESVANDTVKASAPHHTIALAIDHVAKLAEKATEALGYDVVEVD